MEKRAAAVGRSEGKFTDQVEARNKGESFVDEMERKAREQGRAEGKFTDQVEAKNKGVLSRLDRVRGCSVRSLPRLVSFAQGPHSSTT